MKQLDEIRFRCYEMCGDFIVFTFRNNFEGFRWERRGSLELSSATFRGDYSFSLLFKCLPGSLTK